MEKKKRDVYADMELLVSELEKRYEKFTPTQKKIADMISDEKVMSTLPPDFFKKNGVKELNEHFGGHGKMMIDEDIRNYLIIFRTYDMLSDEMMEAYAEFEKEKQ